MDAAITRLPGLPEPTPPHSDDLGALALALGQVDAAHRRLRTRLARRLGLTVTDLSALMVISEVEEATPKLLATELGFTSGTVTTMVDRLVEAGQARREPKSDDRRSILIRLTPEGQGTIEMVAGLYQGALAVAVESSPQLFDRTVLDSLRNTAEALDAVEASRSNPPLRA